jgi:hypothetical protein
LISFSQGGIGSARTGAPLPFFGAPIEETHESDNG